MDNSPIIVWIRRELRLADQPALAAAAATGAPVLPVFVLDEAAPWPLGAASRWWLRHSLARLSEAIAAIGGRLLLLRGDPVLSITALAAETGATQALWTRRSEPAERRRELDLAEGLAAIGIVGRGTEPDLLFPPERLRNGGGHAYQVFGPFWRAAQALPPPPPPLPAPTRLPAPARMPDGLTLESLGLAPEPGRFPRLAEAWLPGEAGAESRLATFLADGLDLYASRRDQPGVDGTSRLSPHLAFGEISPRRLWHAVAARTEAGGQDAFLRQLGWREFSQALLAAHPDLPERPLRGEFAAFPWAPRPEHLAAWRSGRTGFPIVDAGMRQLAALGWMHNRVRMIVGSFLVKDLLAPWTRGEEWFWDNLVDADLAANAASWQWIAGCGADAAPYFRVFNPVLQGEKFDPRGRYVRQWVPELSGLPDLFIHRPWDAPPLTLAEARISLGRDYPAPIVDHGDARRRALAAYHQVRRAV